MELKLPQARAGKKITSVVFEECSCKLNAHWRSSLQVSLDACNPLLELPPDPTRDYETTFGVEVRECHENHECENSGHHADQIPWLRVTSRAKQPLRAPF